MTNNELNEIKESLLNKTIEKKSIKQFQYQLIHLLEQDLNHYKEKTDLSYTLLTIPYFYEAINYDEKIQKNINQKLLKLRSIIQKILQETKRDKQYQNNRKILKKLIGKIEIVSLTLANSYDKNFLEYKLDLLYYLIFSIKNIDVLKSILKKAPHQINILDEKGFIMIQKIVKAYLKCLKFHVKDEKYEGLDNVLYFDRVLSIVLSHNKKFINPCHIQKLDAIFKEEEKTLPIGNMPKERYLYFIYKWRELFHKYLNNPTESLQVKNYYTQKEINYQYMVNEEFKKGNEFMASFLFYKTKFPKIKSYLPNVFTIDGEGAKELDDGFSCYKENGIYHLGVHITNPMAYLKEDDPLFQEALKRVSTMYKKIM